MLADAGTGPFPEELRAAAETPAGDVAVMDRLGDIYVLAGGAPPAVQVYDDTYMVKNPTDLIVDQDGRFLSVSQTPTSKISSIDWVSADGQLWAYFEVGPLAAGYVGLAPDPLTGDLVVTAAIDDLSGGTGDLYLVDLHAPTHVGTLLAQDIDGFFSNPAHDGDVVPLTNGDLLFVGADALLHYDRGSGTSSTLASGFGSLRALAVASSSGNVASPSGFSAYFASGSGTTTIHELGDVGAPGSMVATAVGDPPGRGTQVLFTGEVKAYDLATDLDGNILLGGDHFSGDDRVLKWDLDTLGLSTIANSATGISDRVEGVVALPDGRYIVSTQDGHVHDVPAAGALSTERYDGALVTLSRDMTATRDGEHVFLVDRQFWAWGAVYEIDGSGAVTTLAGIEEPLGVAVDPFSAQLLVTEWHDQGFNGTIDAFHPDTPIPVPLPGFEGMNYSNGGGWADGDTVVDVEGNMYTCSEDDFSVHRYDPDTGELVRIAAGYASRLCGLAISRSSGLIPSTTGWSLYVGEFNRVWEIPDVPPGAAPWLDRDAPPAGRNKGWLPSTAGEPRALLADPLGGGLLVSTASGTLWRIDLATGDAAMVAGGAQGLSGDLVDLDSDSAGRVIAANADGVIFELDPLAAWTAVVLFADGADELENVQGIVVDGQDDVLVSDRPAGSAAGRLFRVSGGVGTFVVPTRLGLRPAIDPTTGDVFLAEQGDELLRVDPFVSPATHGHYRLADGFRQFATAELGGGLAFEDDGDFYLATAVDGRVLAFDRATDTVSVLAGHYFAPKDLALAPGTPGVAGAQGQSLYVLDGYAVFEHGVDGLAAGAPPAADPGGARADLVVHGSLLLGGVTPVSVLHPPDALDIYLIVASAHGKVPGVPMNAVLLPSDPRVFPINPDLLLGFSFKPGVMPGFFSSLNEGGESMPGDGDLHAERPVAPRDPGLPRPVLALHRPGDAGDADGRRDRAALGRTVGADGGAAVGARRPAHYTSARPPTVPTARGRTR